MSNTPETQALLPVTQADRDAAADLCEASGYGQDWVIAIRDGLHDNMRSVQAFARHRQSSSNAGGVDERALRWIKHNLHLAEQMMKDSADQGNGYANFAAHDAHHALSVALASLSTSTAEPMGEETLGRFGHHPDPATDFEHEVDQIEAIITDLEKGMRAGEAIPLDRIDRAMGFRVGGDAGAVAAKASLRKLETRALALTTPPTPHEFVKNPLIPFPSCQVCMGPEDAEAHSPPTPDRIGKDAVREALESVRAFIADLAVADLDEGAADAVTVGMVYQQQAQTVFLPKIDAALSASPTPDLQRTGKDAVRERVRILEAALWSVLSYDQLLRQYSGPQAILFAGDVESIDASYDAMVSKVTAALSATPAQEGGQ